MDEAFFTAQRVRFRTYPEIKLTFSPLFSKRPYSVVLYSTLISDQSPFRKLFVPLKLTQVASSNDHV